MRTEPGAKNIDLRDQPAYPLAEAARYLKLPIATLRSWACGRSYPTAKGMGRFPALFKAAQGRPPLLSFWNLVEAHVLRSLRTDHGVKLRELRKAIAFAEKEFKVDQLLLRKDLSTHAGTVFLEYYGELISLNFSGQIAMRKLLEEHLKRVDWDRWQFPIRLYPFVSSQATAPRPIAIDPSIAFGRPVVLAAGVSTATIAERIDAGEAVADLASDYDLTIADIEQAVLYERAA